MSSDIYQDENLLICMRGVGKFYLTNQTPMRMCRYLMPRRVRPKPCDLWAVRGVNLDLRRGSVLGVIGRNGSGKSTLLQLVAGLLKPSEGEIHVRGSTAALIELGAGFNPEFTGRENVMLSGSIYGYTQREMTEKLDEIVAFAEIASFIDQPVKTYSSGMYARLAFAVAIQVDPDVLLVDEILSVGDLDFQAKCFRKIEALREAGTSILFVSHSLNTIQTLCDRAVLLDAGKLVIDSNPQEVIDAYLHVLSNLARSPAEAVPTQNLQTAGLRAEIVDLALFNSKGQTSIHPKSGERCKIRCKVLFHDTVRNPVVNMQLKTMLGLVVHDQTNVFANKSLPSCAPGDELIVSLDLAMNLCAGPFRIGAGISDLREGVPVPLFGTEALTIEVVSGSSAHGIAFMDGNLGFEHLRKSESSL